MNDVTVTIEDLLRDIYEAANALRWFEQKYGLLSETFYQLYEEGQLRDEDPDEIQEYLEWSGWCELHQDRRRRYNEAVARRLRDLARPASLADLHISQLRVPA